MDDQDKTNQITDDTKPTEPMVEEVQTPSAEAATEEENSPEVNMSDTPVADADADAEEAATDEVTEESGMVNDEETTHSSQPSPIEGEGANAESTEEIPSPLEGEGQGEGEEVTSSDEAETPAPATPQQGRWYVVHTYSGHENKVATQLMQRVESEHLENKIFEVLVPTQDKIEIRGGKKASVKEKIFPGYILVRMELDDLSWLAVRTTQGVTSFVGIGNRPTPVPAHEVASIVQFMSQGASPTFKDVFMVDDTVKIIDGPFAEFIGKVESVDKEKGKVRILVSIFGRETPVELDFLQVTKL